MSSTRTTIADISLILMLVFFPIVMAKQNKKEEEECGEICQYIIGILTEQAYTSYKFLYF